MTKITLQLFVVLATTFGFAQNLITNGTFDDGTGWTVVNQYGTDSTNGAVTIAGGSANIGKIDPTHGGWIHMGLYTSVNLTTGWYQFDMDMAFDGIDGIWGEVYIGISEPMQNVEYFGDQQVIKAYNGWDCAKTYSGKAVAFGCDDSNPGKFEIPSDGVYYLLFRTGGSNYGTSNINLDNLTLVPTAAGPAPVLLTDFNFDFDTATPLEAGESASFNDDATNTMIDGVNTTINIGEISGINLSWWSQLKYQYHDGIDLSSGDRGFSIKVKGPRALPVTIKVEGSEEHSVVVDYTTPNVWQKLDFDFTTFTTITNTKIALFFAVEEDHDDFLDENDNIFQIDDFVFGEHQMLLGIDDFQIEGLSIFPNPTSAVWNLSTDNQVMKSIYILNLLGERMMCLYPNAMNSQIDASQLNSGIYIAQITTKLGVQNIKLIKQ
tara:strand:- start:12638 stop:13942 length:1305 start_codon:yes stop_codon:yes gene_type:complete